MVLAFFAISYVFDTGHIVCGCVTETYRLEHVPQIVYSTLNITNVLLTLNTYMKYEKMQNDLWLVCDGLLTQNMDILCDIFNTLKLRQVSLAV